jgi:DNA helicase-2/ATP-dependent DNA helicase PcrA
MVLHDVPAVSASIAIPCRSFLSCAAETCTIALFRLGFYGQHMALTEQEQTALNQEETTFLTVRRSIADQITRAEDRLFQENQRARALTSEIRETRRVEDKALLVSDEAVSHGLKDHKREEIETLRKQATNPYFARIKLQEELPNGSTTLIEYKLGLSANTDLRIVDWRRAPISKLYYEYQEGAEYIEEILGRERIGTVLERVRVDIKKGNLCSVQNRHGTFIWDPTSASWQNKMGSSHRGKSNDGQLPEILSLITAEQFRSITVDANTAVLIQGVAGSGKTTVALHRLAWLLHPDNSPLRPRDVAIVVLSPALRAYIENSLSSVGVSDVPVRTYHEWAWRSLKTLADSKDIQVTRTSTPPPLAATRVKRSLALLKALESTPRTSGNSTLRLAELRDELLAILSRPEEILARDDSRTISRETIELAHKRTQENFANESLDWEDDALLLRLFQLRAGGTLTNAGTIGTYGHLIIDEVQDLSPLELATVISAVKDHKDLTLVGDTAQNLDVTQSFPGWEALRRHWNFSADMSRYISLEVSHRSTLPIMRLADSIQRRDLSRTGRHGRTPIWFRCRNESQGIEHVLKWLTKASELFPTKIAAVICATPQDAHFAYKMLQPTFGPRVRRGDSYSFSFEEGILVTDVRQVKGLEFYSVLLWNPSARSYGSDELGQNLLYVAVTRAEENLCLVTWERPAKALPPFGASRLVRAMDMTIRDEEPTDSSASNDD